MRRTIMPFLRKKGLAWALVPLWLGGQVLYGEAAPAWELSAQKRTLKNSLSVILEKDGSSATTFLQILIKAGQRAEPSEKKGLSFLTTRLAVEIPDSSKVQELMSLASRFSVTSRGDYSLINVECLSSNFEATLKILSKIMADPLFSGLRINAVKTFMRHQGQIEGDDSLNVGHLASLRAFFGSPGYEGSVYGDEKTLEAIKNKDVTEFYKSYFTASNMILSLSSDLTEEQIVGLLEKFFASIPQGNPLPSQPVILRRPETKSEVVERETKQSYVSLAFSLPEISTRHYALHVLLDNLLGKSPGSRLWPLRSEEKLAYNVNCRVTQMIEGGLFEVYLETDNTKKDVALAGLKRVLTDLLEKGISEEELETTKAIARANFLRDNESKTAKAATLASFEVLGLGFEYFSLFFSELQGITREEIQAYIKEVLSLDKAFEVVVGPKAEAGVSR